MMHDSLTRAGLVGLTKKRSLAPVKFPLLNTAKTIISSRVKPSLLDGQCVVSRPRWSGMDVRGLLQKYKNFVRAEDVTVEKASFCELGLKTLPVKSR